MASKYREHLILSAAYQDPVIRDWTASAHVEFTHNFTVHTVVLKPRDVFETEQQAEKYMIQYAKAWVDHRLRRLEKASAGDTDGSRDENRLKHSF